MTLRSHLALLGFAWGSLGRRRGKSLALGAGLALGVALIAAVLFVTSSLRGEAARARGVAPDLVVQRLVGGRPALVPPAWASFVAARPGVRRARPRVWGYVFLPAVQANVTVVGREPGDGGGLDAVAGALAAGRDAKPGERWAAVVGDGLARLLGVGPGNVIALPSARAEARPLSVVGTFASAVSLFASDVVLLDERDARVVLDCPEDEATDLAVDLTNPDEAAVVAAAVTERLPGARVIDRRSLARVHELTYGRRAGIVFAASLPGLLALLVLAHDRASGLGPAERREIAVLKAVGWSTSDVLAAKLWESSIVGVAATTAGVVLAYGWVFVAGAPGLREVLAGWSVLYPTAPLVPAIDAGELVGLCGSVLGAFVALSVVPSFRAATLDPLDAMRG